MAAIVIGLATVVCAVLMLLWASQRSRPLPSAPVRSSPLLVNRQRAEQQRRAAIARMRIAYRNLQIALLQLEQSPDFRRAAGYAKQAAQVPLVLRHQQFQRFRQQILSMLSRKLRSNIPLPEAAAGLEELITALGIAPFEAEYLITEAQRSVSAPAYAEQVRQSQAEHQRRTAALRSLRDLDPEIREQLTELEHERFRDELLGGQPAAKGSVSELD